METIDALAFSVVIVTADGGRYTHGPFPSHEEGIEYAKNRFRNHEAGLRWHMEAGGEEVFPLSAENIQTIKAWLLNHAVHCAVGSRLYIETFRGGDKYPRLGDLRIAPEPIRPADHVQRVFFDVQWQVRPDGDRRPTAIGRYGRRVTI
jgi:hypothetical protein